MTKKEKAELSARERRRKRRIRNQIWAYTALVVLLAAAGVGAVFGVKHVTEQLESKRHEEAMAEEMAAMQEAESEEQIEETWESEAAEEYTEEDLLDEMVDAGIAEMSLEDRVAALFLTTPEELTGVGKVVQAGKGTEEALAKYAVGGLVYAASNVQSAEQFTKMLTDTLPKSKYPLFLIFDDDTDKLTEDLSVYGINMEFTGKAEAGEAGVFTTESLPALAGEEKSQESKLVTAQIDGEAEEIADACLAAWQNGAELLYVPKGFASAYEGLLAKVQEDEALQDGLTEVLEKIYRIKYQGRLEE